jgi:hypothetical protein
MDPAAAGHVRKCAVLLLTNDCNLLLHCLVTLHLLVSVIYVNVLG